jgi:hypothetical protein
MRRQRLFGDEIHKPEAARVAVTDGGAVGEMEHDVLMLWRWLWLIGELAKFERFPVRLIDAEASGHAEMHDQHLAVVEPRQEIFRAPVERIDLSPAQALSETLRQRKAQVAAPLLDARKAVTDENRRQPQSDRLDLRQFGHQLLPQCETISVAPQQ